MSTSNQTEENATRAEAAAFLRVKPQTLRNWEARKIGPPVVRVSSRKALYPWIGLRAFMAIETLIPLDVLKAALVASLNAGSMPDPEELDAFIQARVASGAV